MTATLVVESPAGSRDYSLEDLPLTIGSAADCALQVPGVAGAPPVAQISVLDSQPLLQPAPEARIALNGSPLSAAHWLKDGDLISTDTARIDCSISEERWAWRVTHTQDEYQTLPPELETKTPEEEPVIAAVSRQPKPAPRVRSVAPTGKTRKLRYVAGGALAVLFSVALFLFTAKAVLIQVEPDAAEISIAGALLKLRVGERFMLLPGSYRVLMTAEGYRDAREEIVVSPDASQEFPFILDKLPGQLVVSTQTGAVGQVWVDDKPVGEAPTDEVELAAGKHSLRIEADRYLPFQDTVEVLGLGQRQEYIAPLAPAWADVTVSTVPAEAEVRSNGELLGATPGTVELLAGTHELVIELDGYKTWRQQVSVEAGQQLSLPEIALTVADGILKVRSDPAAAAVSINGRYRGTTPVDAELKPAAAYSVIISKAGYSTITRQISLPDRQSKTLRVSLEPVLGEVQILGVPAGAMVLLDGRSIGEGDQQLQLPARAHDVTVRQSGFADFKASVTPKPGLPQLVQVRMLTEAQAVLARTPRVVQTSQGAELQLIEPGEFAMGAPRRVQGRRPNETERNIRLTRRFYLARHEVTNRQFRAFKANHTSGAETFNELGIGDHPAMMVSWLEAASFCNWLSDQEGLTPAYAAQDGGLVLARPLTSGYRLPTEAEWAWVARHNAGARSLKYPWGDKMPPIVGAGNFADRSAEGVLAKFLRNYYDGFPVTAPIGQFKANALGIHDLGGNAAEWVNDLYTVYPVSSRVDVDPLGPDEAQYHVIRGSSWRHASISELRLARRDFGDQGRLDVGFRLARWAEPQESVE
ncbi:MAG: PEGA domain-containing protein [Gammaproteobacteria bacterium]